MLRLRPLSSARRLAAAATLLAAFVAAGPAVTPAGAHGGVGHRAAPGAAAAHAAQDLAGVPVDELLAKRDPKAGLRRTAPAPKGARGTSARATRQAVGLIGDVGSWGPITPMPVVPVFMALLPSGKVLMWDSVGESPTESYNMPHDFTRAAIWDPADESSRRIDVRGYNIFCAGFSHLPNGNVLVVGGNADRSLAGIRQTHIFDWRTETWSRGPDMAEPRWYPSVASQANGDQLVIGGGPTIGELFKNDTAAMKRLTGVVTPTSRLYPLMQLTSNGNNLITNDWITGAEINTGGVGQVGGGVYSPVGFGEYGSFAQYDVGRTLYAGGNPQAQATAAVADVRSGVPVVRTVEPMHNARRQHQATIGADGSVIATGGLSTTGLVDLANAVYEAERWSPDTEQWTRLASAQVARQYHSAALLLPDGRILTAGGGICDACVQAGYLRRDAEVFSPPYLYGTSGESAPVRPTLTDVPATIGYDGSFAVRSPVAGSIAKLGLVRLGAPTHSVDQDQRYVPLPFTATADTLTAETPHNAFEAPPGYYMLFAVDTQGVTSVASMVQLDRPAPATDPVPVTPPAVNLALAGAAGGSSACTPDEISARVNNGLLTDRWCSRASNAYVQVDLRGARSVAKVVVQHAEAGGGAAAQNTRSFTVRTSTNGLTWTTVATVTANTAATTTHTFTARSARYVRVVTSVPTQTGERIARIPELEVYGPVSTPAPVVASDADLALTASASGSAVCATGQTPAKAVDTGWATSPSDKFCSFAAPARLQVDLGSAKPVGKVVLLHAEAGGEAASLNTRAFTLSTSTDGTSWSPAATVSDNTAAVSTHLFASRPARYVRLEVSGPTQSGDAATRIYAMQVKAAPTAGTQTMYAGLDGAVALFPSASFSGQPQRLELGEHALSRGNLGRVGAGTRSYVVAAGYVAELCDAAGACRSVPPGRYTAPPAGIGAPARVTVSRVP